MEDSPKKIEIEGRWRLWG